MTEPHGAYGTGLSTVLDYANTYTTAIPVRVQSRDGECEAHQIAGTRTKCAVLPVPTRTAMLIFSCLNVYAIVSLHNCCSSPLLLDQVVCSSFNPEVPLSQHTTILDKVRFIHRGWALQTASPAPMTMPIAAHSAFCGRTGACAVSKRTARYLRAVSTLFTLTT